LDEASGLLEIGAGDAIVEQIAQTLRATGIVDGRLIMILAFWC